MKTIRRRRQENKTDYKSRFALLKSGKPRLVVRKTNRYMIAQLVVADTVQDKVLFNTTSKELLSNGWPEDKAGSLKNLQACYLTGFLLGTKSKEIKEAILDAGMNRNVKKSRIYAVLAGFLASGIKVPHSQESLPTKEDIERKEDSLEIFKKVKKQLGVKD